MVSKLLLSKWNTKEKSQFLSSFLTFFCTLHPNDIVRCNADKLFRSKSSIGSIKICGKEYWLWDTKTLRFSLGATEFSGNGHYICYFEWKTCLFSLFLFLSSIVNTFSFRKTPARIFDTLVSAPFTKEPTSFVNRTWIDSKGNAEKPTYQLARHHSRWLLQKCRILSFSWQ